MPINTIIRRVLCEIIGSRSGIKKGKEVDRNSIDTLPQSAVSPLGGLSVAVQATG